MTACKHDWRYLDTVTDNLNLSEDEWYYCTKCLMRLKYDWKKNKWEEMGKMPSPEELR